jgi:hypothetical protein
VLFRFIIILLLFGWGPAKPDPFFSINIRMCNYPGLRIGLTWSEKRQCYAIVMVYEGSLSFGTWFSQGDLYIYDEQSGDVIEPLHVDTVWQAFELFSGWCRCGDMLQ